MTIKLRDYQEKDLQRIEDAWKNFRSVLYQLPTGGGKSIILTKVVDDYKKENILILAHKRRLLTQLRDHLKDFGIKTGLMYAGTQENMDSNIVIVSIRTAVKDSRLQSLLERNWDRVIIDEARHSRTSSYDKALEAIFTKHPTCRLLGVDATPYRKDKKRLDKHFQTIIVSEEDTASLIEKGYLSKFRTFVAPLGEIEEEVDEVANDYQQQQLSEYMRKEEYLNYIVDTYEKYGEKRQALVFAVDIEHSEAIRKKFIEKGITSISRIDSKMSQSQVDQAMKDFEDKKIQLLVNVEMLTEGVDLPDAGCIIGARPTKSLTLYLQMIGRGTRIKSNGEDLIILDCCGWTKEYGQLNSPKHWSLNPEVDPNNLRANRKVFGKKIDGTYTEDLKDFVGEIVEMDAEEFLKNIKGGKEQAEKINEDIDVKINKIFTAIHLYILKNIIGIGFLEYYSYKFIRKHEDRYEIVFFKKTSYDKTLSGGGYLEGEDEPMSGARVEIDFIIPSKQQLYAKIEDSWYNNQEERVEIYMLMSRLCGVLNEGFSKKNLRKTITELLEQVEDLMKSKINLESFEKAEEKLKEEQFMKKVEDFCKTGKEFILTEELREDHYFPKDRSSDMINAIQIPSNNITIHHNTIILTFRGGSKKTKKYIKGEKVYELLRRGKWDSENIS